MCAVRPRPNITATGTSAPAQARSYRRPLRGMGIACRSIDRQIVSYVTGRLRFPAPAFKFSLVPSIGRPERGGVDDSGLPTLGAVATVEQRPYGVAQLRKPVRFLLRILNADDLQTAPSPPGKKNGMRRSDGGGGRGDRNPIGSSPGTNIRFSAGCPYYFISKVGSKRVSQVRHGSTCWGFVPEPLNRKNESFRLFIILISIIIFIIDMADF